MAPLAADRNTPRRGADLVVVPVAADTKIYAGSLVAVNATGYAVPGSEAVDLKAVGRAEEQVDNTGGLDGAKSITVRRGVFLFSNAADDAVDQAAILGDCYIVDDETVAATDGEGTRSKAGQVLNVDSDGVWVAVGIYVIPAAAQDDIASEDAAEAAGTAPDKAEFDAVVALANEIKAVVNGLLANLRAAGHLGN